MGLLWQMAVRWYMQGIENKFRKIEKKWNKFAVVDCYRLQDREFALCN